MTRKSKTKVDTQPSAELAQVAAEVGGVALGPLHIEMLGQAGRRSNGALLPLPDTLPDDPDAIEDAIATLLRQNLIEAVEASPGDAVWQTDKGKKLTLRLTMPACILIGVQFLDYMLRDERAARDVAHRRSRQSPGRSRQTKSDGVLKLLRRQNGATIDQLTEATGWQPHSVRAALTGLRKKGHAIERSTNAKRSTVYRVHAGPK